MDEFEFVAVVYSTWHLDSLEAWISERKLRGLVIVRPQGNVSGRQKYRLSQEDINSNIAFSNCQVTIDFDERFEYANYLFGCISNLFGKSKTTVFFLSPKNINIKAFSKLSPNSRLKCIVLDEGTGSYISQSKFDYFKSRNIHGETSIRPCLDFIKSTVFGILRTILIRVRGASIDHWQLFERIRNGKLIVNAEYAKACEVIYERYSRVNKGVNEESKGVIFLDYKVMPDDIYYSLIERIIDNIEYSQPDLKILVKPHPNNSNELIDAIGKKADIVDSLISGEKLIASLRPKVVLGGWSTVTFNSAAIFGIRTYSFMPMYLNCTTVSERNKIFIKSQIHKMSDVARLTFIHDMNGLSDVGS